MALGIRTCATEWGLKGVVEFISRYDARAGMGDRPIDRQRDHSHSGWWPMTTLAVSRADHRAIQDIVALKSRHTPIVMVTAYDYSSARAAEASSVDMVLVGDSAATTMLGLASTREVTLDEMLMITRAVRRGLVHTLLIGDMPFGTYEVSNALAID